MRKPQSKKNHPVHDIILIFWCIRIRTYVVDSVRE